LSLIACGGTGFLGTVPNETHTFEIPQYQVGLQQGALAIPLDANQVRVLVSDTNPVFVGSTTDGFGIAEWVYDEDPYGKLSQSKTELNKEIFGQFTVSNTSSGDAKVHVVGNKVEFERTTQNHKVVYEWSRYSTFTLSELLASGTGGAPGAGRSSATRSRVGGIGGALSARGSTVTRSRAGGTGGAFGAGGSRTIRSQVGGSGGGGSEDEEKILGHVVAADFGFAIRLVLDVQIEDTSLTSGLKLGPADIEAAIAVGVAKVSARYQVMGMSASLLPEGVFEISSTRDLYDALNEFHKKVKNTEKLLAFCDMLVPATDETIKMLGARLERQQGTGGSGTGGAGARGPVTTGSATGGSGIGRIDECSLNTASSAPGGKELFRPTLLAYYSTGDQIGRNLEKRSELEDECSFYRAIAVALTRKKALQPKGQLRERQWKQLLNAEYYGEKCEMQLARLAKEANTRASAEEAEQADDALKKRVEDKKQVGAAPSRTEDNSKLKLR